MKRIILLIMFMSAVVCPTTYHCIDGTKFQSYCVDTAKVDGDSIIVDSFATTHRCSLAAGTTGRIRLNYRVVIKFMGLIPDTVEHIADGTNMIEFYHDTISIIGNGTVFRHSSATGTGNTYLIYTNGKKLPYVYGINFFNSPGAAAYRFVVVDDLSSATAYKIFRKCIFADTTLFSGIDHVWFDSCIFWNARYTLYGQAKVGNCLIKASTGACTHRGDSAYIYNTFYNCSKTSASEVPTWTDVVGGSQGNIFRNNVVDSIQHNVCIDGWRNSIIDSSVFILSGGSAAAFGIHTSQANDSMYNLQMKNNYIWVYASGKIMLHTCISDSLNASMNIFSGVGYWANTETTTRWTIEKSMFSELTSTLQYMARVGADTVIYTNPLVAIRDTFQYIWPIAKSTNRIITDVPNRIVMGPYGFLNIKIDTIGVTSSGYGVLDSLNSKYRWNNGVMSFQNYWFIGDTAFTWMQDSVAAGAWTKVDSFGWRGGSNRHTFQRQDATASTEYFYRFITKMSNGALDTSWIDSVTTAGASTVTLTMSGTNCVTTPVQGESQVNISEANNISCLADTGWTFSHWDRSGAEATIADSNSNATTVILTEAATVTAILTQEPCIIKVHCGAAGCPGGTIIIVEP